MAEDRLKPHLPPHPHCFHLHLWSEPDLNHVWCRYHSKSISCLHSLQTTAQCSRQQITAVECQVQSVLLLLQSWAWHGPRLSRDGHVWTHQPTLSLNMLASVNDPLFLCPPHPKKTQVSCTSFNSFHVLFFHALLKENTLKKSYSLFFHRLRMLCVKCGGCVWSSKEDSKLLMRYLLQLLLPCDRHN